MLGMVLDYLTSSQLEMIQVVLDGGLWSGPNVEWEQFHIPLPLK